MGLGGPEVAGFSASGRTSGIIQNAFCHNLNLFFFLGANLGPPGKPPQMDDSYNPYNLMSSSESPTSPLVPPESWGPSKNSSDKMANGTNINWPPGLETYCFHQTVLVFLNHSDVYCKL